MARPYVRRQPLRPAPRDAESMDRAAARSAELLGSGSLDTDTADKYFIDPDVIPDGWSYEWKRKTVYNQEDPSYQVELVRMGWEPVPTKRHPEMMPQGWTGETIERDGMVLMERPEEITSMVKARDLMNARKQADIGGHLQESPEGQFQRQKSDGESLVKIRKHMEPMEIPDE